MATKEQILTLSNIDLADPYIRKDGVDFERVETWAQDYRDKIKPLQEKDPGMSNEDALNRVWEHPPIVVMEVPKPYTVEWTDKKKTKHTRVVNYKIVDGMTRYHTAVALGRTTLAAKIHDMMPQGAYYMMQYKLNSDGPKPFDRETRDAAIRFMATGLKMLQEDIAREVRLTVATISRIVAGKLGKTAKEKSESAKRGASKRRKRGDAKKGGYNAADFFKECLTLAREASNKKKVLQEFLLSGQGDEASKKVDALGKALAALRTE